jgi:hypothetical protein
MGWELDNARKTIAEEPHMRFPTLIHGHGTNRKCWAVQQSDTRPRSFCSTQRYKYPPTKLVRTQFHLWGSKTEYSEEYGDLTGSN